MSPDIEEPREGGSYIRHPDGTLELVERTAPPKMRPERLAEEAAKQVPEQPSQSADAVLDEPVQPASHHAV